MSGFPVSFLSFFRYRKPCAKRNFLTRISGFVSLPEIFDIISLHLVFEKISAIKHSIQYNKRIASIDSNKQDMVKLNEFLEVLIHRMTGNKKE